VRRNVDTDRVDGGLGRVQRRVGPSGPRSGASACRHALEPGAKGRVEPEEIATAVAFLASDEARCITAEHLSIDAGAQHF
jgi:NAD(P)-dependent dehydrogenase (short-subunit alcohol dehydrogenase family)